MRWRNESTKSGLIHVAADAHGFGMFTDARRKSLEFGKGLHGLAKFEPEFSASEPHGVSERDASSCFHS